MAPEAFIISGKWPFLGLSDIGMLSRVLTCGRTVDHIGIAFYNCDEDMVRRHSQLNVAHYTAKNDRDVTFDYLSDRHPRFQGVDRDEYWSENADKTLYEIRNVDVRRLHDVCVYIAVKRPTNHDSMRCNPLFGGCWSCPCATPTQDSVGLSHCAALCMRAIACAYNVPIRKNRPPELTQDECDLLLNDRETMKKLNIKRGCLSPRLLIGFTPSSAVAAMRDAGVLGPGCATTFDERRRNDESLPLLPMR